MAFRKTLKTHKRLLALRHDVVAIQHDEIDVMEQSIEEIKVLHTWSFLHECAVTTAS